MEFHAARHFFLRGKVVMGVLWKSNLNALRTLRTLNNQYSVSCTLYSVSCTLKTVLSSSPLYNLRWIFPETHLYFIGDKGEDDEGNDE